MAKIQFTEGQAMKDGKQALSFVEAVYDGKTHRINVYAGDTRTDAEKAVEIRKCLDLRIKELAVKEGKPFPEAEK